VELTSNDRRLIALLKENARLSVSDLARTLSLSRTTVQKRIGLLEAAGIIAGYSLRLGQQYKASTLQAYVSVVVRPRYSVQVAAALERMIELEALYTVSGKIDLVAIVRASSPAELDTTLDRIGAIEGVEDTDSAIVLATKFDRR